ncbi:CARDB domain-containing protein [Metallosphaera cuprina]|uniref:CARDB domain-containing protein n=1 Tax=Metallosphaera cuprina (strain Ar-4) TaxID=1006006 RepID=F4FZX0_METCR|nr:CARDB domain-containing protein [Metallosphaera cuprina]AEB95732.1 conserved hypothetical protein [Metallosphaera cuprina Ar-4]
MKQKVWLLTFLTLLISISAIYQLNVNSSPNNVVPNSSSNDVYTVTFNETGLPQGTQWTVKLGNLTNSSNTNIITFKITGLSYLYYSIPNVNNYIPTPYQGYVLVNRSLTIDVNFSLPYLSIKVNEELIQQSTGSQVSELEPGNTYEVGVSVYNQGNINSNVIVNNTMLLNGKVIYSETSFGTLDRGTKVSFSVLWTPNSTGVYTLLVHVSAEPNFSETFSYPVYVGVSNAKTYNVSFVEVGLPQGSPWSVTLNGVTKESTSKYIEFQETSGNFTYLINNITGFLPKTQEGTIVVTNSSVNVTIVFLPLVFKPVTTVEISYNNSQVTTLNSNLTYSVLVNIRNEGNYSGSGYLILTIEQGSTSILSREFNFTLAPMQQENFSAKFTPLNSSQLTMSAVTYSITQKGQVSVSNITKVLEVQPPQHVTTSTSTTQTNTTKTNTSVTTTNTSTSVTSPPSANSSSSSDLLYVAIVIVVIIIVAAVVLLRRRS